MKVGQGVSGSLRWKFSPEQWEVEKRGRPATALKTVIGTLCKTINIVHLVNPPLLNTQSAVRSCVVLYEDMSYTSG